MSEENGRQPMLTDRGRLWESRWASRDVFEYNKPLRPSSRLREWECYRVSNPRFTFQVYYGHGPGGGRVAVTLVDFDTGEKYVSGKRFRFPGDSLDLDFSPGEPHTLKYEDDGLFLSISYDGAVRQVTVRSDRFDAELIFPDTGDAIAVAVPFGKYARFLYQYKKVFPEFSGHIHMHKLDYRLTEDTAAALSSDRGVLPFPTSRIWAVGGFRTEDGYLALNLGEDFGPDEEITENALFFNGKLQKLGKVYFKYREDDLRQPWRISDEQRRLHLEFYPTFDNYERIGYLGGEEKIHQLFGKIYGKVKLSDGAEYILENNHFVIEQAEERR